MHSELNPDELRSPGISPTTIRFAVGTEAPKDLIRHLIHTARLAIDPDIPGFSNRFLADAELDALIRECYVMTHRRYIDARLNDSVTS